VAWERLDGQGLRAANVSLDNHNSTLVFNNTNLTHAGRYRWVFSPSNI
jgi:hypothetical protein